MQQQTFWIKKDQPEWPILRGRRNADVAVVGGGVSGVCTALWLAKAGLRVALLEAGRLFDAASAYCAGIVSLTDGLLYAQLEQQRGVAVSNAYAQTQLSALQAVRDLAREQGESSGWQDADAQLIATDEAQALALEQEAQAMKRAGIAAVTVQPTQCPLPATAALELKDMGVLHPIRYYRYLTSQAVQHGVKIFERSRVTALETNVVYTQRGSVLAPYIVVATGYPIVNTPGWYFLRTEQRQGWLMPLEGTEKFKGIYLAADGSYALRKLREGALFQMNGSYVGAKTNYAVRETFQARYAEAMGSKEPAGIYGGIWTSTADGVPYIGPYSAKTPNLFVTTGYGARGLIGSMVAAQAISARILGLPGEGYEVYAPQRGGIGKRLTWSLMGRYAAGFGIRPLAPKCPHMGCKLVYNPRTRIWECPCHGSRFDDIGHVLNAPAVHDAHVRHGKRG